MKKLNLVFILFAFAFTGNFEVNAQTKNTSDFLGRIDPDDAAVLLIDHQTNLILGCQSMENAGSR